MSRASRTSAIRPNLPGRRYRAPTSRSASRKWATRSPSRARTPSARTLECLAGCQASGKEAVAGGEVGDQVGWVIVLDDQVIGHVVLSRPEDSVTVEHAAADVRDRAVGGAVLDVNHADPRVHRLQWVHRIEAGRSDPIKVGLEIDEVGM